MITRNEKKTSSSSSSSSEENSHGEYAMQLASLSVFPMVLKSAIDLGLLQIIAKVGPGHNSIATILKHQSVLIRCFGFSLAIRLSLVHRLLVPSRRRKRRRNGAIGCMIWHLCPNILFPIKMEFHLHLCFRQFKTSEILVSVRGCRHWAELHKYLCSLCVYVIACCYFLGVHDPNIPFNRAYGMNAFDYVGKDSRCGELFKGFMGDYNPLFMNKILETYNGFEGLNSIMDVGGGNGAILNMIVLFPSTLLSKASALTFLKLMKSLLLIMILSMLQETCSRAFQKEMPFS
ncbi:hypothetical protein ACSBR2_025144 [Camellia fascicularis]